LSSIIKRPANPETRESRLHRSRDSEVDFATPIIEVNGRELLWASKIALMAFPAKVEVLVRNRTLAF